MPAPSPAAKKFFSGVSRSLVSLPLGQGQGQVAGDGGGQGGVRGGLAHAVGVGAHAADQIAEALDQHAAGQHVGKRGDVLAVAIRLVERLREVVGD